MKNLIINVGDQIVAKIGNDEITGTVIGFGIHKGRAVIDFVCDEYLFYPNRFVYPSQIVAVFEITQN